MIRLFQLFVFMIISMPMLAQEVTTYPLQTSTKIDFEELQRKFANPPSESRLRCYWWWLNSMATRESITRDLEEMKAKGYGGASIVDAGSSNYNVALKTAPGPVFMSEEWMKLYKHAVKEAERLGIELSVNVQSGWNPGAPSITPEFALKKIVWTEINVTGGKKLAVNLPKPKENLFYQDIVIQAIKKPTNPYLMMDNAIKNWNIKSFNEKLGWKGIYPLYKLREDYTDSLPVYIVPKNKIVDLIQYFKNETLTWDAPSGEWTIIRYGYTCTGARTSTNSDGWEGLSVDHLNPEAFNLFSNTVIEPLINAAKEAGNSVKFLQTDSWEMDLVSWSNHFPDEFKRLRGYDIMEYLPVLAGRIVGSSNETNRFLHDFRKTIGDCIAENHYQLFSNLAHKNGMGIHPESGGPHSAPVDGLKVMAISDFPQGEFWACSNTHRIKDDERLAVKQSACVAHTNGKKYVAAEGPTSIGPQWERSPKDLKANIDRIFCSGVNRIVWHTFTSSPKEFGIPGNEYFAGTRLNPNVTWWKQAGDFISYLNRCSYMLAQGLFVADVLYYYGNDVPNFVFLKEEFPELKFGYDWDKCSKDVIINRLSFDGTKIRLPDGMSYRVLVLQPDKSIDLEVLRKIEALVKNGMTIISPKPEFATGLTNYPASDKEIKEIAERMWGNIDGKTITENCYGKGKVIWGKNINDILLQIKAIPDFEFTSVQEKTALDYIHRATDDADIYFLANRFARKEYNDFEYRYITTLPNRYEQVECKFRVTGKIPLLFDPITGEMKEIVTFREENGQTIIPLFFEPEESKFIVFKNAGTSLHIVECKKDGIYFFPNNSFPVNTKPMVEFLRNQDTFIANVYEHGDYNIKLSNGKWLNFTNKTGINEQVLSGKWNVFFKPELGGPGTISMDSLQSWTDFKDEKIKYYSGTAVYSKTFTLESKKIKQNKILLDLGNVQEMASIKINGKQMQVHWCVPFQFDITDFVKKGINQLEIEVVNMWPNRLIGDGKLSKNQRITKTNVIKYNSPDGDKYLRASGLIGTVKIKTINKLNLK